MKLNFKASNIAKAERNDGCKFFDVFNGMSTGSIGVSDLLFLYHAGGASDEDFDKDFGKGIEILRKHKTRCQKSRSGKRRCQYHR